MHDYHRRWEYAEDQHILQTLALIGPKWDTVLEGLPADRTKSSVRNRWMRLCKVGGVNRCKACNQLLKGHSCPAKWVLPRKTPLGYDRTPSAGDVTDVDLKITISLKGVGARNYDGVVGVGDVTDVTDADSRVEWTSDSAIDDETDDEDAIYDHVLELVKTPLSRALVESLISILEDKHYGAHDDATRQNAPVAKSSPTDQPMQADACRV